MKVRMLVHGSGPDGAVKPGSEVVVSDDHGEELVAGGYAEQVPEPAAEETPESDEQAAEDAPETEADEPAAEKSPEPKPDEPVAEDAPETETKKKAPRKRRRTAKSAS